MPATLWPLLQSHILLLTATAKQIEAAKAQHQQSLELAFTELAAIEKVDPETVTAMITNHDGHAAFAITPKEAPSTAPKRSAGRTSPPSASS